MDGAITVMRGGFSVKADDMLRSVIKLSIHAKDQDIIAIGNNLKAR